MYNLIMCTLNMYYFIVSGFLIIATRLLRFVLISLVAHQIEDRCKGSAPQKLRLFLTFILSLFQSYLNDTFIFK